MNSHSASMSLIYKASSSSAAPGAALYLGGKKDAKSKDDVLHRFGITHVLNVTPPKQAGVKTGVPNYFEKSNEIVYKRIPVFDSATSDILPYATEIIQFLDRGLCHGSVLVHCQRGVSRSPTCMALYLMRKRGMTLIDAMALLQKRRPSVNPIPAFLLQLEQYEKECIQKGHIVLKTKDDPKQTADGLKKRAAIDVGTDSKRKRVVGPEVMVSTEKTRRIGPSLPPNHDVASGSSAIGPNLPPVSTATTTCAPTANEADKPYAAAAADDDDNDDNGVTVKANKVSKEKANNGSTNIIGPQLPS